jgi:ribonuclease-3
MLFRALQGSMSGAPSLEPLEQRLGHSFRDRCLLERALTHSSCAHESGAGVADNEPLEFLGDAVLSFLVAEMIFRPEPLASEGSMSRTKAWLVSDAHLADIARDLGLGEHLRLGVGEEKSGGRSKPSLLAGAMEALLAAVFLDGGVEAARGMVEREFGRQMEQTPRNGPLADAKTTLQEALQGKGLAAPTYRVVEESGPDHRKSFRVQALLDGRLLGEGSGASKKAAEQEAAREALITWRGPG